MNPTNRKRIQELAELIHSRLGVYEIDAFMQLLYAQMEEVKSSFVSAPPDTLAALQIEAQTYDKLIRLITRPTIKSLSTV